MPGHRTIGSQFKAGELTLVFELAGTGVLISFFSSTTDQGVANMRAFTASATAYITQTNRAKTGRSPGYFLNFAQGDERIEEVHGPNLPRLRKLKAKYDPKKLWKTGCVIEPDFHVVRN